MRLLGRMMQVIHYIECDSNGWRPNGVAFRCRARRNMPAKCARSRARSGQLHCSVRRPVTDECLPNALESFNGKLPCNGIISRLLLPQIVFIDRQKVILKGKFLLTQLP